MARIVRARRAAGQTKTAVWYERSRVGVLTRAADNAISFEYDAAWITSDTAFPVASALPLSQAKWQGDPVVAAFDNLLPDADGDLRDKIALRVGAQGKDVFSLLSVLGRDCAGALQFLPLNEAPSGRDMDYRTISPEEMVADLQNLAAAPLAQSEDEEFRISIAGAQEKTAYLRVGGQWAKPRGITPTSHIFKTPMGILPGPAQIDMRNSVENELFCMTLAREMGLPVARVEKLELPGQVVLSIERFDRVWQGETLKRLPQEDICQSLGYPSTMKYQTSGGPGIAQIMELLRESDQPLEDRETFFRAQIFFYLIGASDGHAKNFSLQLGRRGRFRLAPLYDILSVAPAVHSGQLPRRRYRLAMSIDGHYGIDEIVPRHFEAEGRAAGLPKGRAAEQLQDLAERTAPALERAQAAVGDQVPRGVIDPIVAEATRRAMELRHVS